MAVKYSRHCPALFLGHNNRHHGGFEVKFFRQQDSFVHVESRGGKEMYKKRERSLNVLRLTKSQFTYAMADITPIVKQILSSALLFSSFLNNHFFLMSFFFVIFHLVKRFRITTLCIIGLNGDRHYLSAIL